MDYVDYLYKVPMKKISFVKGASTEDNGILVCKDNESFSLKENDVVGILKKEIYEKYNNKLKIYLNLTYNNAKLLLYDPSKGDKLKNVIINFIHHYNGKIDELSLCVVDVNDIKRENYACLLDPEYSSLISNNSGLRLAEHREKVSKEMNLIRKKQ